MQDCNSVWTESLAQGDHRQPSHARGNCDVAAASPAPPSAHVTRPAVRVMRSTVHARLQLGLDRVRWPKMITRAHCTRAETADVAAVSPAPPSAHVTRPAVRVMRSTVHARLQLGLDRVRWPKMITRAHCTRADTATWPRRVRRRRVRT